jgi:hypothetical protein
MKNKKTYSATILKADVHYEVFGTIGNNIAYRRLPKVRLQALQAGSHMLFYDQIILN